MVLDEGDGANGNRYDVSLMRHMAQAHTNELALLSIFAARCYGRRSDENAWTADANTTCLGRSVWHAMALAKNPDGTAMFPADKLESALTCMMEGSAT